MEQTARIVSPEQGSDPALPFQMVPLNLIGFNPDNARKFEQMTPQTQSAFAELVASVREKGIIQPVLLRPKGDGFLLIAGERRTRAALKVTELDGIAPQNYAVPAVIKDVDDREAYALMLVENLQRQDLTPFEEARSYKSYIDQYAGSEVEAVQELARQVNHDARTIRRKVALLTLPQPVLDAWQRGDLTQGHVEQFTRLADSKDVLVALTECLRARMTLNELRQHLERNRPPLKSGLFDRSGCGPCGANTSTQRSLFEGMDGVDVVPDGVCMNPACFKAKQGAFFGENWASSKAKQVLGTNGFRFKEDLPVGEFESIVGEVKERCLSCPTFVSCVTVQGQVVSGQEKVCVGPKDCYEELYALPKPAAKESKPPRTTTEPGRVTPVAPPGKPSSPRSEDEEASAPAADPKKSAKRAQEQREKFYAKALPEALGKIGPDQPQSVRLTIVALALANSDARFVLQEHLGQTLLSKERDLAESVIGLPSSELLPLLQRMSLKVVMDSVAKEYNNTSDPMVRHQLAPHLGVCLQSEFVLTEDYLTKMTIQEIVKVGEELDLWGIPAVKSWWEQKHQGKALRSLKKKDLVEMALKAGPELKGLTPKEILETKTSC